MNTEIVERLKTNERAYSLLTDEEKSVIAQLVKFALVEVLDYGNFVDCLASDPIWWQVYRVKASFTVPKTKNFEAEIVEKDGLLKYKIPWKGTYGLVSNAVNYPNFLGFKFAEFDGLHCYSLAMHQLFGKVEIVKATHAVFENKL